MSGQHKQKAEQLALALEGPATEVLRDLDTSRPQAYNIIWEALARRFGSLDGAREAMRRFDSRRQEDNETIPDFEQALRTLHRVAWPTATPEQGNAALKRRFEDGFVVHRNGSVLAASCPGSRFSGHSDQGTSICRRHGSK